MKKSFLLFGLIVNLSLIINAQTVTDIDGNIYHQVTIGGQVWLKENLKTTRYSNGDTIGTTVPATLNTWGEPSPKYQWAFQGDESYVPVYGRLYTWYAATDLRSICPTGWHLPTDAEWTILTDYLGGQVVAGGKLKEAGTSHWNSPNTSATNESGFRALPGSNRIFGKFNDYIGQYGSWWSSTTEREGDSWIRTLYYNYSDISRDPYPKGNGYSVRCTRDQSMPIVTTNSVSALSSNSVRVSSYIAPEGGTVISARGICWSTDQNPDLTDFYSTDTTKIGECTSFLTGLIPNTKYFAKSYATNASGTSYGEEISFTTTSQVFDANENTYNTIKIGNQLWMKENLKTTKYRNGDTIYTTIPDTLNISSEIAPKYQWAYNGDENNVSTYGRLYTWYTIIDKRGVCPSGWHIPSTTDWNVLTESLGGEQIAGGILKDNSPNYWYSPNFGATNSVGFNGLPGGARRDSGSFRNMGKYGYWLVSAEDYTFYSWLRSMNYRSTEISLSHGSFKNDGSSARCIKDNVYFFMKDAAAVEGETIEIPVLVSELLPEHNIKSYKFDITFDTSLMKYKGYNIDETISDGCTIAIDSSISGLLTVSSEKSSGFTGTYAIIWLRFYTLKAAIDTVLISNAYLNDMMVDSLRNGIATIWDITNPTAVITYNNSDIRYGDTLIITAIFSEPMDVSRGVFITMYEPWNLPGINMTPKSSTVFTCNYIIPKADGIATVYIAGCADLFGNTLWTTPTGNTFTVKKPIYGDINEDSLILDNDAELALQYSVGLDPIPTIDPAPWKPWRENNANVDDAAGITANDAGMILQYSAGIISNFIPQGYKSGALVSDADILVKVVENDILFYSSGALIGLNISVPNAYQILGLPIIMTDKFISAFNINDTSYSIGMCSAYSPANGVAILKIPYNRSGPVTLDMTINTLKKTVTIDPATGIVEFQDDNIIIYPNPAWDNLKISGLTAPTIARIFNTHGKLVQTKNLNSGSGEISVSELSTGVYVIKLQTDKEIAFKRFAIR